MLAIVLAHLLVATAAEPTRVDVRIAGPEDAPTTACARVRDVTSAEIDLHCDAAEAVDPRDVVQRRDPDDVLARFEIDLHARPDALLYLVDPRSDRILVRRIPGGDATDAVFLEQLAQIVATAIEALRGGAVLGLARADAVAAWDLPAPPKKTTPTQPTVKPTPPAPPKPPEPRPHAARLDLAIGYGLTGWSSAPTVLHGPFVALAASDRRRRVQPGASIAMQAVLPTGFTHPLVSASIDGHDIRGYVRLDPRFGAVSLRTAVGIAALTLRTRPRSGALEGTVAHVRLWDVRPILAFAVGLDVAATEIVHVQIDALLDVELRDTRYVLGMPPTVVFDPWRVRPGVRIAFAFDVLGRGSKKDRPRRDRSAAPDRTGAP